MWQPLSTADVARLTVVTAPTYMHEHQKGEEEQQVAAVQGHGVVGQRGDEEQHQESRQRRLERPDEGRGGDKQGPRSSP